jgi:hypothetical protein
VRTPTPTPTATAGSAGGSGSGSGSPAAINPSGAAHPTVSISGGGRRTLGLGRRATALVSLVDAHGRPISSARLTVLERLNLSGAGFRSAGLELTTDAGGAAQLPISPGPSRTLRVTYREGGGDGAPDATADVLVLVRSKTTLRKSRSFLRNGDTLRFSGRLLSMPVPASGVGIDLQAQVGHHWQTFKTLKTNGEGRWRSRYRFRSTRGLQTYRFRARVRGDSAFPYLPSTSKQISVRVQG